MLLPAPQTTDAVTSKIRPDAEENLPFISGASPNLDFLRTFAVLLVVVRHLMSVFGFEGSRWVYPQAIGIFGVILFFVHTSLVLMFSLERQTQKLGTRHFYVTFLVRRAFRIYPLSVSVVLLLAFVLARLPVAKASGLVGHLTSAGILSNLLLVQDFAHQPNITGVLWSLPLEMQMYLFLPVLFLYAKKLRTSGLLWLWAGGVMLGLIHAKYPGLPGLFEYVSCFLPGVLCYTLARQKPTLPFWMFPLLLVLLLAVYQTAYGVFHHGQAILGMPACLLLGFLLPRFREVPHNLLANACKIIARYSYGIYLLHWNAIWLAFIVLHSSPVLTQWAVFAAGFVLGPLLAYHAIEEPMIKVGNRLVGYIHRSRLTPQP